jgi:hypothetical protein
MVFKKFVKEEINIITNKKMVVIYLLKLEHGKYYVGKTNNLHFRLRDHFGSKGTTWTAVHKPLEVIKILPNCDEYDEDKYTLKYMDKYGMDNVRGGSFCSLELDKETIKQLEKMSKCRTGRCFRCGDGDHYARNCPQNEYEEYWCCEYCDCEFKSLRQCEYHEQFCIEEY